MELFERRFNVNIEAGNIQIIAMHDDILKYLNNDSNA